MILKYKRTHKPTGTVWINDFNDTTFMPHKGATYKHQQKLWVGECEKIIQQWNKMGIVDGQQMWYYELVIDHDLRLV